MGIGLGLYGANGHQVFALADANPSVELVAAAGMPEARLAGLKDTHPGMRFYESLQEMLLDARVQLVSLCSPVRRDQVQDAILCMQEGKHVYAEKPCAFTVEELAGLMKTAAECDVQFHDMAGTAFDEPYRTMREIVRSGRIGEVVQILVQKSYPYYAARPQDEDVDGGLLCQVGIHALRMIEHVACRRIGTVAATETKLGNPDRQGGLHMAASYMMTLEGGGIASAVANYLNQPGFGSWGNETLRIFGTKGFVEAVDGGARTRLVIEDEDLGELKIIPGARDYFDLVVDAVAGIAQAPLSMEDELHPTRAVLRAKESANRGGVFLAV